MATQNINLNNVDAVKYQGQDVSEVKLNNQTIWKQPIETPGNFRVAGATRPISLGEYNRVEFRWEDAGPEKKYIFQYSQESGFLSEKTITVELPENTTSYVATKHPKYPDRPIPHGWVIYGHVKAVSSTGESTGWSPTKEWHFAHDLYYHPLYVANKYIEDGVHENKQQKCITIQWDMVYHNGSSETSYVNQNPVLIERSTDNQHWTQIAKVQPNKIPGQKVHGDVAEYLDYNVVRGATYYYRMSAIRSFEYVRRVSQKESYGRPTRVAKIKCQTHQPMHLNYLPTNKVVLPLESKLPQGRIKIDWGDGTFTRVGTLFHGLYRKEIYFLNNGAGFTKTYSDTANRTIKVYGDVTTIGTNKHMNGGAARLEAVKASNENMVACSSFGDLPIRRLEQMFYNATNLQTTPTKIPVGCWSFHMAFAASKTTAGNPGSHHRTHLDLSGWDMRFAHDFTAMFSGCTSITTLNLSNWDLEVACDFSSMCARMDELTSLNLSGWSRYKYRPNITIPGMPTNRALEFSSMFHGCKKLTSVNLPPLKSASDFYVHSYWERYMYMFRGCKELTSIPGIENWDVSGAAPYWGLYQMFESCHKLTNINLSKWCTVNALTASISEPKGFATTNSSETEYAPFYQTESNRPKWGECVPSCAERSTWNENCQKI
jgi:surface protein